MGVAQSEGWEMMNGYRAAPSPRLIPEGEKPETLAGLARHPARASVKGRSMSGDKTEIKDERRRARAQREANRAENWLTLPLRVRAGRRKAWEKRSAALKPIRKKVAFDAGRRMAAPAVKKKQAADKRAQFDRAIRKFLGENESNKRLPAKSIAEKLRAWPARYFDGRIPYKSESKFLRVVKTSLAVLRPRRTSNAGKP